MDHTAVNTAITEHLGLWWTPEREQALEAALGSEGAAAIFAMYRFAEDQTDLWREQATDVAYAEVQRRLRREYPFLTAKAAQRLADMAAFTWK